MEITVDDLLSAVSQQTDQHDQSTSNQPTAANALTRSTSFPFKNRSFPGDIDSDILPYPAPVVRKKKATREHKFFLLTSKEAHQSKRKEAEEKLIREKKKADRAAAREKKAEERQQTKFDNTVSCNEMAEKTTKKSRQTVKQQKKTIRKQKSKKMESKKDSTPCGVCGVMHFNDTSGNNWIQCSGCNVWYHNACQGLDEDHVTAFFCIACDSD